MTALVIFADLVQYSQVKRSFSFLFLVEKTLVTSGQCHHPTFPESHTEYIGHQCHLLGRIYTGSICLPCQFEVYYPQAETASRILQGLYLALLPSRHLCRLASKLYHQLSIWIKSHYEYFSTCLAPAK